ncbi:MAG: universal stress protein [Flavobacteriaceae bacterium]
MNKRILIPTDFSSAALNASRYAMQLFAEVAIDFYLLNAYQISGYSVDSPFDPEPGDIAYQAAKSTSEKQLAELLEHMSFHPQNPEHRFKTIASYNSLLHAAETAIAENDIDLVVMGTKGITGAESLIFGTNAINLMEGITNCPVLTIPEDYGFQPPNEIVFPTDFKLDFKKKELQHLIEIARINNAAIRVLHIEKNKELSRQQRNKRELLKAILEGTPNSFHVLKDRHVHNGIGAFVSSRDSQMIAFINRKHNLFSSLLSRPLVKEIGYHYKIPILALNDQA